MKSFWLFILLTPFVLVGAWIGISHHPREQTVFLERIAVEVERARAIPPETEHAIKDTVASIRRRALPVDEQLDVRQKLAIERIETGLSIHSSAMPHERPARASKDMLSRRLSSEPLRQ